MKTIYKAHNIHKIVRSKAFQFKAEGKHLLPVHVKPTKEHKNLMTSSMGNAIQNKNTLYTHHCSHTCVVSNDTEHSTQQYNSKPAQYSSRNDISGVF